MSTESMGLQTQLDDGLDIDFGLGIPQEATTFPISTVNTTPVQSNQISNKDDLSLATIEHAPSEINYDSDIDADAAADADADADADATTNAADDSHEKITAAENDEISWDDGEDENMESNGYGIEDSNMSSSQVDVPENPNKTALPNSHLDVIINTQDIEVGAEASHKPDTEAEDTGYLEDYDYELDNPRSQAEEGPYEAGAGDAEYPAEASHGGLEKQPEVVEIEDDESYGDMADERLVDETDENDVAHGEDSDYIGTQCPEVQVLFAGNEYSLFRDPNDAHRPYILEDSLFQARASELLDALHDALGDELCDGDELVVQVQELCLEISPMMASTLQSMSISDFAHLHAKLVLNDGSDEPRPLRLSILAKPSFSSRYQELLAGVSQGVGLSLLARPFDIGQGCLYSSPIKNELGDIDYANDVMDYEESGEGEEAEEGDGDDASNDISASCYEGNEYDPSAHAVEETAHDGVTEEGDVDYYNDDGVVYDDEGAVYYDEEDHTEGVAYNEAEQHAEGDNFNDDTEQHVEGDNFNDDTEQHAEGDNSNNYAEQHAEAVNGIGGLTEKSSLLDETRPDQQAAEEHEEDKLELGNNNAGPNLAVAGEASTPEPVETTASYVQDDDAIDWVDGELTKDGKPQTGTYSSFSIPCTKHLGRRECDCRECIAEWIRIVKDEVASSMNSSKHYPTMSTFTNTYKVPETKSTMDSSAVASQLATVAAGTSRNSTPSVTIDGDTEVETSGISLHVDAGPADQEGLDLGGPTSHPHPPPLDEISWEGDDDGDDFGNVAAESKPVVATANVNGKRQHPGDGGELNQNGDAIDFKRRRPS